MAVAAALSGAVWRERGRLSPVLLLLLLVLSSASSFLRGVGKGDAANGCPSGSGRVGAVPRGTVSLHAIIARRLLRTLQGCSVVFPQLVRVEGVVKNR